MLKNDPIVFLETLIANHWKPLSFRSEVVFRILVADDECRGKELPVFEDFVNLCNYIENAEKDKLVQLLEMMHLSKSFDATRSCGRPLLFNGLLAHALAQPFEPLCFLSNHLPQM